MNNHKAPVLNNDLSVGRPSHDLVVDVLRGGVRVGREEVLGGQDLLLEAHHVCGPLLQLEGLIVDGADLDGDRSCESWKTFLFKNF